MRKGLRRQWSLVAATSVLLAAAGGVAWAAAPGSTTGESSGADPYLVRHTPGITVKSILTTGDSVDGYRMAGIPDGLGAYDNGDGTFTVLMNHELSSTSGVARAHGGKGSFISKWVVDRQTLRVISGSDLIERVHLWDGTRYVQAVDAVFNRFCSADLAAPTAYFNPASRKGYPGRIFTNGEETSGGRAFAHVVDTGETFQLPDFGAASWENVVANPNSGDRTVVIGTSDTGGGKVYVYVGDKQDSGNPVQQAGLAGGTTYAVSVTGLSTEDGSVAAPDGPLPFTLTADGGTGWDRPEDGAWDPNNPNDFYFVTTASMTKHSRLWRLRFDEVTDPSKGGTLTMIFEGPASGAVGPKMMDNLTVNDRGQVLIQEDPGNQAYLAGIYQYDLTTNTIRRVADHDPQRFLTSGAWFDTQDEESSGIIPVPFLGAGIYLIDVQNHTRLADPELVEKGQLLLLNVPPGQPVS